MQHMNEVETSLTKGGTVQRPVDYDNGDISTQQTEGLGRGSGTAGSQHVENIP